MSTPGLFSYASPLGRIAFAWDGRCVRLWLADSPDAAPAPRHHPLRQWLDGYFAGAPGPLPPLAPPTTPFQARLRATLWRIPFGETRSYGELARQLATSPRALGQALGANPLPLLVPCHRIVAAHGIGGFSAGATWKLKLLELEGARAARTPPISRKNDAAAARSRRGR